MIKIADIMTTNPHTASEQTTLEQAISLCNEHKIRHIPIVDNQQNLIGLVSERTLLAAQESSLSNTSKEQRTAHEQQIMLCHIMVTKLHTVDPEAGVGEAARHIERYRIGCLPVVDGKKLIGIITDTDFVGVAISLLEMLAEQEPLHSDT
ncbi:MULTISPECIES: CBS domain-containing protein [unclassified Agarivorans]|uniref:CBS domain-containing protein n=1 Tax=unclassified Agarivorans TaxID=2636026 RepID=UPI0026E2E9F4|nr:MULTISPECIES: CBS domain-containing protein [unclassified Agarivorans]MDO6686189.1 CBS domain-containing protein [Agarivorans sp. 3_MG-2023]MDO6716362.1 CBS domain-containing protein [Agarivorans sp. 2_MG-2023]